MSPELQKLMDESLCKRTFLKPCTPIGAAGGTADFFTLTPTDADNPGEEWLGKDLSRAFDELGFYSDVQKFRGKEKWELLNAMIEYAGVLKEYPCRFSDYDTQIVDLLVMRSMLESLQQARLLDIKVGAKTADANWKGKSRFGAWQQGVVDNVTNSVVEGVRLEGFMNPPAWVDSEDPLLDIGGSWFGQTTYKRAKRVSFQRFTMAEVLHACFDLRQTLTTKSGNCNRRLSTKTGVWEDALAVSEYTEMVSLSVLRQLSEILRDCAKLPIPQKWIGSSVAIVLEVNCTPPRVKETNGASTGASNDSVNTESTDEWVNRRTRVCLFDWGRSELNTPEMHEKLEAEDKENRAGFWTLYQDGISTLLFEATRHYYNRFCVEEWTKLELVVYDYDSQTSNDFLGRAELELPTMADASSSLDKTLDLKDSQGKPILGAGDTPSTVELSLKFTDFPAPSRMKGAWLIQLKSAKDLLAGDVGFFSSSSDPMAVITLSDKKGRRMSARTSVVETNLEPTWEEVLEFPVAKTQAGANDASDAALMQAMQMTTIPEEALKEVPDLGIRQKETVDQYQEEIAPLLDAFFKGGK